MGREKDGSGKSKSRRRIKGIRLTSSGEPKVPEAGTGTEDATAWFKKQDAVINEDGKLDGDLERFAVEDFDAKSFAKKYYENRTDAQAKAYCVYLMQRKASAAQQLQRRVFKHYPKFIESSLDLQEMESDMSKLRRCLGKNDFLLSTIENAATGMSKIRSKDKEPHGDGKKTKPQKEFTGLEKVDLRDSLELTRFKNVQALICGEDFEGQHLIDAPDRIQLLLHKNAYQDAVDLINEITSLDVEGMQVDLRQKLIGVDPYMLEERLWGLRFAKQMVEEKAEELVEELVSALEMNVEVSDRDPGVDPITHADLSNIDGSVKKSANHPVLLLQKLGRNEIASRGFLHGRAACIKELSDEVIYSSLASDPEQCILELSQRIFRRILETNQDFSKLFLTGDKLAKNGYSPDALLSCLMVWNKNQVAHYCLNFCRFLLPGYKGGEPGQFEQSVESILNGGDSNETEENMSLKAGVPFASEVKGHDGNLVTLTNEEWRILGNCLRWTLLLCRRLEKDGLTLNFMVTRQLKEPLNVALESIFTLVERNLRYHLSQEKWHSEQLRVEGRGSDGNSVLSLTESGQKAYELVHGLIRKVKKIYSTNYSTTTMALEARIIQGISSTLQTYLDNVVHFAGAWSAKFADSREEFEEAVLSNMRRGDSYQQICKKLGNLGYREKRVVTVLMSEPFTVDQLLSMISDVLYMSTDLIKRTRENFEKLFKRQIEPLRNLERSLDLEVDSSPWRLLSDAFVTRTARKMLNDVLHWSDFDYSKPTGHLPRLGVSPNFDNFAKAMHDLKKTTMKRLGNHSSGQVLVSSVSEHILVKLEGQGTPSAIFGPVDASQKPRLSADLQLVLDLPLSLFNREPSQRARDCVNNISTKV
eukprot:CAMPEP_0203765622 /NCGR_PEP_ID=MMETSP0098-20131031/18512_1 /ASSEMBLY_ACC=CAM_ASM_000208 /TAXON_ID=96639 /ORGANISM=" , Strain NY0313808BC1" /LENGTH=871 /DNA_ID=CAMNT_0050661889 /DNA_START=318 /DNA_END=2933 /DNA_ORIENTATION=+